MNRRGARSFQFCRSCACVALVPGLIRQKQTRSHATAPTAVRSTIVSLSLHRSPYSISCVPKSASGPSTVAPANNTSFLQLPAFRSRPFSRPLLFPRSYIIPGASLVRLISSPARLHHIAICFFDERGSQPSSPPRRLRAVLSLPLKHDPSVLCSSFSARRQ